MQILQTNTTFVFGSELLNNVLYFTGKDQMRSFEYFGQADLSDCPKGEMCRIDTTNQWEQETGTYYFGARRYDSTIGQWLGYDIDENNNEKFC